MIGLFAVRRRSQMYIGSTSTRCLHHMIYEIIEDAIDEALLKVMPEAINAMPCVYSQRYIRRIALRKLGFQYSELRDVYYIEAMEEPLFHSKLTQCDLQKTIIRLFRHFEKIATAIKARMIDRLKRKGRVRQSDANSISMDASQPIPPTMAKKGGFHGWDDRSTATETTAIQASTTKRTKNNQGKLYLKHPKSQTLSDKLSWSHYIE